MLRHEVGHVFGAWDAYPPTGPTGRFGYLKAAQGNACGTGGGYFAGAGECLDDLMAGWGPNYGYNSRISPSTAGQLGWFASDGDGMLDVMRTMPDVQTASVSHTINASTSTATYHGVAADRAVLNEEGAGNVSINRITAAQYRIVPAPWQDASPTDGVFDSAAENFTFTTPPLRNGAYTVEIQAVNTIGAATPRVYSEQLVVTNSNIANTRPFAVLRVSPERAVVGTTFQASAGGSVDLETGALAYSWNWNGAWTPFSPNTFSSYNTKFQQSPTIALKGAYRYTVRAEVRDRFHGRDVRSWSLGCSPYPPYYCW